jgi:hypothetical protein
MPGDEAEAAGLMDAYLARGSIHDGRSPTSVPPPLGLRTPWGIMADARMSLNR